MNELKALLKRTVRNLMFRALRPGRAVYLGEGEVLTWTKYFTMIVPGWDLSLTPSILMEGVWGQSLTDYLRKTVKHGNVMLDVGANLGWFSCVGASLGASVHAFEPNPRLQRILRKNIFLNAGHNAARCAVNQAVVSDCSGIIEMRFPHWLAGGAGLHDFDQGLFLDSMQPESVSVPQITLDTYLATVGIEKIDVIKMDIEGHEEKALCGAEATIARSPGLILCMEYSKGHYSAEFPNWLFEHFDKAHVPGLNRVVDLRFLKEFEAGATLPALRQLDIVFERG